MLKNGANIIQILEKANVSQMGNMELFAVGSRKTVWARESVSDDIIQARRTPLQAKRRADREFRGAVPHTVKVEERVSALKPKIIASIMSK